MGCIRANTRKSRGFELDIFSPDPLGMDKGVSEGNGTGSSDPGSVVFVRPHNGQEEDPVAGYSYIQPTTPSIGSNQYYAVGSAPRFTSTTTQEADHAGG